MNYYAQGGEAQGLKSIARELQDYGRNGDTMLAHINPQEAAMLKAMGGSGTINPHTGLREYGIGKAFKGVFKPVTSALKGIEKAVIRPIGHALEPILPYVQYVAPFIPGIGPLAAAGLGALGSGFSGPGGFNFKKGLMGGMTAYGLSNLYAGLQGAGTAGAGGAGAPVTGAEVAPVELAAPGAEVTSSGLAAGDAGASVGGVGGTGGATGYAGYADAAMGPPTSAMSYTDKAANILNTVTNPSTYSELGTQMSNAGQGIKNLTGMGDVAAGDAAKAFSASGATMTNTLAPAFMGYTGSAALDEAEKMKADSDAAASESAALEAAEKDRIEKSRLRGVAAMQANPYMFAEGGPVPQMAPGGLAALQGQRDGYEANLTPYGDIPQLAKGGMAPRFLSGGGDGMSDDIPATINGKQPARLADGEFVVPADVVSHLGNGSSKAGAKQLYSMMDKVRSARTGTKQQGKQINPNKYMPA